MDSVRRGHHRSDGIAEDIRAPDDGIVDGLERGVREFAPEVHLYVRRFPLSEEVEVIDDVDHGRGGSRADGVDSGLGAGVVEHVRGPVRSARRSMRGQVEHDFPFARRRLRRAGHRVEDAGARHLRW